MKNKVKVTANEQGKVVVPSTNNSEWGHIRVEQERLVIDDNGFASVKRISALIPGKLTDLEKLNFTHGQEIEGCIIVKEQLSPFNKYDPDRDLKIAGKTGVVCKIASKPIYRKTFFSTNSSAEDVFITDNTGKVLGHDNIAEIREAYNKLSNPVSEESNNIGKI